MEHNHDYHFFIFRSLLVHLRNFKNDVRPTGIRSVHFRKAEWEPFQSKSEVSVFYLSYRGTFTLVFLFLMCFSMGCSGAGQYFNYYFLYFTNWTLMCGVIYALIFGIHILLVKLCRPMRAVPVNEEMTPMASTATVESEVSASVRLEKEETVSPFMPFKSKSLNWLEISIWIMQSVVFTCSYVVTIGYWALIYDSHAPILMACDFTHQVLVHGANAAMITVDLMICAIPVHLSHVLYPTVFGIVYIIFSGLYHVWNTNYPDNEQMEHPYIYNFANWGTYPVATGIVLPIAGFVSLTVLQFLALLLYSIRLRMVYAHKRSVYREHLYQYKSQKRKTNKVNQTDLNENEVRIATQESLDVNDSEVSQLPTESASELV